ncbi:MAG: PH domain-containing protein [Actinomycetaceae bacterium]|nr:PH domain-containing protein [Actinomycetaceae bacterium]
MALSRKLLGKDEKIIIHMHEHIKRLIPNMALSLVLVVAMILAFVYLPEGWRPTSTYVIIAVFLVALFVVLIIPWLVWLTSTYTITNRRIITRKGIFTKTGHDIPLARISNVAYEHDFIDRFFKAGTLELQTSADDPLPLHDIPNVEQVHVMLTDMLFSDQAHRNDPHDI